MCENDPNCPGSDPVATYPLPAHDDPHGWTIGFQIELGHSPIFRTIGWVGDKARADEVAMIAAMLWSPILSFGAVPAPRSDEPQGLVGITERPPLMPEDFPLDPEAANAVPAEYLAGADARRIVDAMRPAPVLMAARVVELLRERGVDVPTFFDNGRARPRDLDRVLGPESLAIVKAEFPAEVMTLGVDPEDLPCICGNCNKPGQREP